MGGFSGTRRKDGTWLFGITDILVCEKCAGDAYISRRVSHPDLGAGFELQTFSCPTCGHEQTRSADHDGDVMRTR